MQQRFEEFDVSNFVIDDQHESRMGQWTGIHVMGVLW
jgi:hypothetical protein